MGIMEERGSIAAAARKREISRSKEEREEPTPAPASLLAPAPAPASCSAAMPAPGFRLPFLGYSALDLLLQIRCQLSLYPFSPTVVTPRRTGVLPCQTSLRVSSTTASCTIVLVELILVYCC
jgi:hypothetical protein